jgi:catechol 2,3-dioxygenase-like lactoylglutathione lyase family enzyme
MHHATDKTKITGLINVAVPVGDQDRALTFYTQTLGFETRRDLPFGSGRWIEVAPPGSPTTIALAPASDQQPAGLDTGIRLATRDAEADHKALQAAGIDTDHEVTRAGEHIPAMFTFRDPDGNRLVLVEQS